MVCEWGMSDAIGTITIGESGQEVFIGREWVQDKNYSEETAEIVDKEVHGIINNAHDRCRKLLSDNINILHAIAEALISRESIDGKELDLLVEGKELPPVEENEKKPDTAEDAAAPKDDSASGEFTFDSAAPASVTPADPASTRDNAGNDGKADNTDSSR
ncbi:MAG: cell division protein FtsH, partial [Desulfovibrionaceae bacterium]|nr:cell division protein FtsH [Desulfovibrionaceae bacterium]